MSYGERMLAGGECVMGCRTPAKQPSVGAKLIIVTREYLQKKNQKKFKWVNAYTISVGDESSVWITALEILQTDLTKLQAL